MSPGGSVCFEDLDGDFASGSIKIGIPPYDEGDGYSNPSLPKIVPIQSAFHRGACSHRSIGVRVLPISDAIKARQGCPEFATGMERGSLPCFFFSSWRCQITLKVSNSQGSGRVWVDCSR
jgi:hypothetical protein